MQAQGIAALFSITNPESRVATVLHASGELTQRPIPDAFNMAGLRHLVTY